MPGTIKYSGNVLLGGGFRTWGDFRGGGGGEPPSGTIQTFTLKNDGGATHGYYRLGLVFKKGDMPSGSVPVIKRGGSTVAAQFDQRATWEADSSIRVLVASIRDDDWTAPETSREYTVEAASGSYNNTGTLNADSISGSYDPKVTISNCTGAVGGARASANATASYLTAVAGTPIIERKIFSGAVCEGWRVDVRVGTDDDLTCCHYVIVWKDSGGSVHHVEYMPVMELCRWKSTTKDRLSYDAVVYDGATTLATYNSCNHMYHSTGGLAHSEDGNNDGRAHQIGVTMDKVIYEPDYDYWYSAGMIDPIDRTLAPSSLNLLQGSGITGTYRHTPFVTNFVSNGNPHRYQIGPGGEYNGRGTLNKQDTRYIRSSTHQLAREARVSALIGMHMPQHYRDDTTNIIKSLKLDGHGNTNGTTPPAGAINYDFTGDGMPAPVDAFMEWRTESAYQDSFGSRDGDSNDVTGGYGGWGLQFSGSSHRHDYSYFWYLVSGDPWLLQSELDLANATIQVQIGSIYGGRPTGLWSHEGRGTGEQFSGVYFADPTTNPRGIGFAHNQLAHAAAIVPDTWPEANYVPALAEHTAKFWWRCYDEQFSAAAKLTGFFPDRPTDSKFQQSFVALGVAQMARCMDNANSRDFVKEFACLLPVESWIRGGYAGDSYAVATNYQNMYGDYDPAVSPFLSASEMGFGCREISSINTSTNEITMALSASEGGQFGGYTVNDRVFVMPVLGPSGAATSGNVPGGLALATTYYVVSVSGANNEVIQLSETEGGAAINITADNGACWLADIYRAAWTAVSVGSASGFNADDYCPIDYAALVLAHEMGVTAATAQRCDDARTFLSGLSNRGDFVWFYKRTTA